MYTNFDYQKEKLTKEELADYLAYRKESEYKDFDISLDCYETILKMLDEEYKGE